MRAFILLLIYAFASLALATPGGVDANGCHESPKKGLHCHKPRIKIKTQSSEETPAQRDKRLRRECKGRPNAGACLGYTR